MKVTRVTCNSSTCIDHIYSNFDSDNIDNNVLVSDVSDHYSTLTKVAGLSKKSKNNSNVYVRKTKLSESEWDQFNSQLFDLLNAKLPKTSTNYNVNLCAGIISDAYQSMVDKFMPLRKLSRKQKRRCNSKPWMTKGLKVSCDTKFELLDQCKLTRDPIDYHKYRTYLNLYTHMVKSSRYLYYCEKAALYSQDKSKTWCLINELSKRKRKKRTALNRIRNKDKQMVEDPKGIANCINKHFGSVGKEMASKFDKEHKSKCGIKDPIEYVSANVNNCVYLNDTDLAEIIKLISNLELRKACGYDHISNRMLKSTSHVIAPFIVQLYNNCINPRDFSRCL